MNKTKYNMIAVLDTIENKLIPQSFELIAFAESFTQGDLLRTLLVVSGSSVIKLCESISENYGIDTAALEHDELYYPNPELLSELLIKITGEHKPEMVMFTHTIRNCQCASKLSVSLKASSATAVESFMRDNEGYVFQRSVFNGKFKENVRLKNPVKIVTVLPGAYTLTENRIPRNSEASVIQMKFEDARLHVPAVKHSGYKPLSLSSEADTGVKLEDADVIISAGRGIGKEENLELIRDTASIFQNSAVGGSRPVCDQRWLPFNQQVGITGKSVSPKLYMACGISGSQQHIAGMKNSQCIAAINKDPNASIFSISDYIIVEDLVSFLPVLIRKFREKYGECCEISDHPAD